MDANTALRAACDLLVGRDVFALADRHHVAFYARDDHTAISFVRDQFTDAAALEHALRAYHPLAMRSALLLLALVDPRAAGPLVLEVILAPVEPGLAVARYVAIGRFDALGTLDDDAVIPLLERPDMNRDALAAEIVAARPEPERRRALLARMLAGPQTQSAWYLVGRLVPELAADELHAIHDGGGAWADWAEKQLVAGQDRRVLERHAAGIDSADRQVVSRALRALIALGPERAEPVLWPRYFEPLTEGARDVLFLIESRILLARDARWKKSVATRAIADRLADDETPLGLRARSLAAVTRGHKPLPQEPGPRPKRAPKK